MHSRRRLPRGPYKTLADVEYATAGWVDWYNNRFTVARLPCLGG
jgi:hypothetical protein